MVIGYCGKSRNAGVDPDALAQTWRDRVHLQADGSAANSKLGARLPVLTENRRPSYRSGGGARPRRLAPASPSHAAEFSAAASSNAPSHMRSTIGGGEGRW
jgi:hypothetical protein